MVSSCKAFGHRADIQIYRWSDLIDDPGNLVTIHFKMQAPAK
jgi:hypothetical protein